MSRIVFFSAVLLLCACSSPDKIPDDVMNIDKMKPIVWDLMRAGALSDITNKKDTASFRKKSEELYLQIFKDYGITREEFYKSYRYYLEHPDKNKVLMDSVTDYANRERINLYKSFH